MSLSPQEKVLAAALKRYQTLERATLFDPSRPGSTPNAPQLEVLKDISKVDYRYVTAGNQCLAEGTMVMTPFGPVAIENLKPGDWVYSEHGKQIQVTAVHDNGVKEVADITNRGRTEVSCTHNHEWQIVTANGSVVEKQADSFHRDDRIVRVTVKAPLGKIREPHAYAIGALLGDGCSREPRKDICISSQDALIPEKVSGILGGTGVKRQHEKNFTWILQGVQTCNYYEEWCKGRYAHEKTTDLAIIKNWDRASLLQFVAGLIDTDGTIYPSNDFIQFGFGCQAKPVVDALAYAVLALWQIDLNRAVDNRAKYKNGPVYTAYTNNANHVRAILAELDPHLVSPQKKYRPEYERIGGRRSSSNTAPAKWGKNKRLARVYDITVDSDSHLYLLANGMVTHNCGKSQTGGREVSWLFTETHPYWTRPAEWGDEPLVILCLGLTTRQIEEIMWRKIKSFLNPDEYREIRANNTIQKAVNPKNGNTIIFISMNDPKAAREHVQGFVAMSAWVDEQPPTIELLEEVQRRLQAKRGSLLCTFTPKVKNRKIRQAVDNAIEPYSKRYKFSMFDNPIYTEEDKKKILASLVGHSQAYINCILYGDWMPDDEACYSFDYEKVVVVPEGYHAGWRHVAAVDPALKSKLGLSILAEDPKTNNWYVVRAEYLAGLFDPVLAVQSVEKILKEYNVVRRIYDSEAAWWAGTVSHLKAPPYMSVYKKAHRKGEMMKNLQHNLGNKLFIAPWETCSDLIKEFEEMRWAEGDRDKIVGESRFHLHDATNYANDLLPKPDPTQVSYPDLGARLSDLQDKERRAKEHANKQGRINKGRVVRTFSRGKFRVN